MINILNQAVLVGRLVMDPHTSTKSIDGNPQVVGCMQLAIPRSFKNKITDNYDTDYIDVLILKEQFANNIIDNCKAGDLVGVKGRLQSEEGSIFITAEKITFLSSSRKDSVGGEEE